ncbi:MAG: hypothetical protein ACE5KO_02665, partial [Candidatus Bathyarchaeia archaeon]
GYFGELNEKSLYPSLTENQIQVVDEIRKTVGAQRRVSRRRMGMNAQPCQGCGANFRSVCTCPLDVIDVGCCK